MVAGMKKIISISKSENKSELIQSSIVSIESAREMFMYFSERRKLNYNQNFILEVNLNFESILKQLHGWSKSII
jgi:hypothetical protein